MSERGYFDHITPEGTCAKDMKSEYGFKSGEILAENCGGMTHYADGNPIHGTSVDEAVDVWMGSRGHRYNLLYEKHTKGDFCGIFFSKRSCICFHPKFTISFHIVYSFWKIMGIICKIGKKNKKNHILNHPIIC